ELWLMNGPARIGTVVPSPAQAPGASWTLAGSADFDGDGVRDLLWRDETSFEIVIWYLDANVQLLRSGPTTPASVPAPWHIVAIGDYGKGGAGLPNTQDIVWQDETSRRVVVWHMDRTGTATSQVYATP